MGPVRHDSRQDVTENRSKLGGVLAPGLVQFSCQGSATLAESDEVWLRETGASDRLPVMDLHQFRQGDDRKQYRRPGR
jgi:hypothetical protein